MGLEMSEFDIKIFGEAEDRTVQQLQNCLSVEEGSIGVLCGDNHVGYAQPVGGVVAYRDHISVSGVGFDIGCGNKAVKTSILYPEIRDDLPKIMDEITRRISFGVGQPAIEVTKDHPVYDSIYNAEYEPIRKLRQKAKSQLGTVGAGNHYVDLFKDETDRVWIGVHFGSRGFGHTIASGFLSLAQGKLFDDQPDIEGMDAIPTVFHINSELGYLYLDSMKIAGEYAYAGRDIVCDKVLDILGAESMYEVHNHHNYAWQEEHFGETFWVVRKGATPAFPEQEGFVGASMGENSIILEGVDSEESKQALYSTVHGAGRQLSRTQAKGKTKRRKRWECNDRDCDYYHTDKAQFNCADHPEAKPIKRWYEEVKTKGLIDFDEVKKDLVQKRIILKGGAADEAPGAYKRLDEIIQYHKDTINIETELIPIGVAMAGPNVNDPYKD